MVGRTAGASGFLLIATCLVVAAVGGPDRRNAKPQAAAGAVGPERRISSLLLDADLETGDFSQFDHLETKNGELEIVMHPARAGRYAARARVTRSGREASGATFRAEAVSRDAGGANHERERWFAFSTYLPEDWQAVKSPGSDVLFQIHERADDCEVGRSPPLVLRVIGAAFRWEARWDPRPCTRDGNRIEGRDTIASIPIVRARWVDWVVHVRWSYEADGLVELWQDAKKLATRRGPNAYNDQRPMYLKIGVYRSSGGIWPERLRDRVVYFDGVRMAGAAGSYEAVGRPR